MVVGRLVERAAQEMKERWSEGDFTTEVEYEHPDGYPWDQATFRGDAYLGYGWGVACVEVEVDKLTNEVKTLGVWSSHEIGKAIDELIVHGQINGASSSPSATARWKSWRSRVAASSRRVCPTM